MRENRLADGRDEVFPTFIEASSQAQHSLEEGDRSFNAGTKALSETKQKIMLSLGLFRGASSFLGDGNHRDLTLQAINRVHAFVVALVSSELVGIATEELPVAFQNGLEQLVLDRSLVEDIVVRDEFAVDLLNLDHVSELDVFAGLATFEQFRVRLEDAEQFLVIRHALALDKSRFRLDFWPQDR